MIVQISLVRNELPLIKQLLPIWSKYADAFVFLLDTSDDGTEDYLTALKNEYNILEIIVQKRKSDELWVASEVRQCLFDAARKYSNKIICLDADEYLDGSITKNQLETLLDENKDTVLYLYSEKYYLPCKECAKMIVQVGIKEVVVIDTIQNNTSMYNWEPTKYMFEQTNIKALKYCKFVK
jgi:hypothetical protein